MSFGTSYIFSSNSGNLNSTTTFTGAVPQEPLPTDAVVIETHSETENDTILLIDETARKTVATDEQITEEKTTKKLSEHIWLKLEKGHQGELKNLPSEIKRMKCFMRKPFASYYQCKRILLKDAVFFDELSGKKIFNPAVKSIAIIPVFPEKLEELNELVQKADERGQRIGPKIRSIMFDLNNQRQHGLTPAKAEEFNACFGKVVFNLYSLLDQGIHEAKKEVELLPAYKSKKRSLSDTGAKLEENFEPGSKKRRTDDNIRTTKAHVLKPDDYLAAMELVELGQSEEYPLVAPFPSGQIDCYFQQPIKAPLVSE